jgi:CHAD domain-containing protein
MMEENEGPQVTTAEQFPAPGTDPATPPAESKPEVDAGKRVRQLALKQLNRFMTLEPKVLRGDDPDAIHDLRVASRRLQQILDLLYPKPRPRGLGGLRQRVRRARRCLSEVRNCDVLLERVEKQLAAKRASRREIRLALRQYLRDRRAESFEKSLRKLGKVNLAVFYLELRRFLAPGPGARGGARRGRHQAAAEELTPELFYQHIGMALERVWQAFETQLALSHRDPRPAVLHSTRIATKRLRYLLEVVAAFDVPAAQENLRWLRQVQRRLGEWHDLEVLEQMMIEMVARPDFLRERLETAIGVEKLIAQNRAVKKRMQESYFRVTVEAAELRRLRDWVGYLVESPSAALTKA